jgi:hypothetical protein
MILRCEGSQSLHRWPAGEQWVKAREPAARYWLATVPDPASGYVSLRSVVTDVHGDSSVQTIYRAFAVAG